MRFILAHSLVLLAMAIAATAVADEAAPAAGDVRMSAALSPARQPYIRPAEYVVMIEGPESLDAELPGLKPEDVRRFDFPDARIDPLPKKVIEVRADEPVRVALGDGRVRIVRRYVLDPIVPGVYLVPPFVVNIGEGAAAVSAPPVVLHARDLSEGEVERLGELAGIVPPEPFVPARPVRMLLRGALAALAALSLLGAAVATVLWRVRKAQIPPPPPAPWEVARQRLRALAARRLPESGRYEAYYVDLSAILRYYLEDRFGVRAPEQTTPELLETVGALGVVTPEQQAALGDFLVHCDRVKFARYVPNRVEMDEGFERVSGFIEETVPLPGQQTAPNPAPAEAGAA